MAHTDSLQAEYDRDGYVRVNGCLPVDFIRSCQEQLLLVIRHVAASHDVDLDPELDMDAAFNRLCERDRSYGAMVYDCMRFHPLVQRLADHPKILEIAEALLRPQLLYHVHDQVHFRIDRRGEDRFALLWHQDYWYNNTTTNAVTAWIPLVDVPLEKGPVRFLPGSHQRIAPVLVDESFRVKWDMSRLFTAADPVNDSAGVDVTAKAGDVVFLHALSMHRSGQNRSPGNRFTVVLRFSDLLHEELLEKKWRSGVRVGWASLIDQKPEVIQNLKEVEAKEALSHAKSY